MSKVVVIGSGLAGSLIASRLCTSHRVTVIEQALANRPIEIRDRGRNAHYEHHVGAGPGGTTHLWHNGLIQAERSDYDKWPGAARDLGPFLREAHLALSGVSRIAVEEVERKLRREFEEQGIPRRLLGEALFYPVSRRNLWHSEGLSHKPIARIVGRVERLLIDDAGRARAAVLAGAQRPIDGDVFVLCAGGLGTPLILQATGNGLVPHAGRYYHDHPHGFVARVVVKVNLNRVWNRFARPIHGNVRLPMVIRHAQQKFAFYFRPDRIRVKNARARVRSILSELRNSPLDPRHYAQLLVNTNDIIEGIALRTGINVPTRRFLLYMMAEQQPQQNIAISRTEDGIVRDWKLDERFFAAADAAIEEILRDLRPVLASATRLEDWREHLQTGAHHSGTCRMADEAASGVCDRDGKVFGTRNVYVCDASAVPAIGYANSGLTIGALALRMVEHLRENRGPAFA